MLVPKFVQNLSCIQNKKKFIFGKESGQNLVLDWILRGQKLDARSKHGHDLVVNWYWAKHGHIMVFNRSKHGFRSIIGQNMGDPH